MASFDHELLVELFRRDGRVAVELLQACAGISLDHAQVDLGTIDLSQVVPTEYRADAVATLRDGAGRPVAGVIVEVQRHADRDKRLTWPVYIAALRAKLECAVVLLVVAPEPEVAAWARQPIELGHPGFQLTPVVVGFADVPWVRDRATASRLPELAVLSALAHPELEIAQVAVEAISRLPEDQARLYLDVVLMALPAAIRQTLEDPMQDYQYRSEFARKYYGEGLEKGLEKGLEGGLRAAAVALARVKLGALSAEDLAVLDAVSDQRALTQLITALGQAGNATETRAALDHARAT